MRQGPAQSGGRAVSVASVPLAAGSRVRRLNRPGMNRGNIVENAVWTSLMLFAADGGSPLGMWWPLIAIVVLFWFLLIVPQQREKKRRQAMLSELKKNDRVITVGGIYGVVTNVHREADEVTIKVDETANVKIRVTRGSVARVLSRDESSDDSSSKKT
jgi:preprotein translocase subunit YajC